MSSIEEREIEGIKTRFFKLGNFILGLPYEIGPRVLYLASSKNPNLNLFGVIPNMKVETSEGIWRIYGGHKLWSSPEAMPRSYSLDDKPVQIDAYDEEIIIHGNLEKENSIQKEITIKLNSDSSLKVEHKIKNIRQVAYKTCLLGNFSHEEKRICNNSHKALQS